jgi:carboxyl-terminal processing protease
MLRLLPILPVLVCAAPLPMTDVSVSPVAPEEARTFAAQLLVVADEVSRLYVRPVTRKELLHAALTGLYEQQRLPLPEDLAAELEKGLKPPSDPAVVPEPTAATDEGELQLLTRARIALGSPDVLQGGNDLRCAIQSMLRCLDPYCGLVGAEELRKSRTMEETRQDFGLEWAEGPDSLRVTTVTLGGPAQRAGIRPGDEITLVNGKKIDSWVPGDLHMRMNLAFRGPLPPGASQPTPIDRVTMTLHRGSAAPRDVILEWDNYRPESVLGVRRESCGAWDYWFDREQKIAHVRLGSLEHGIADELTEVLEQLREGGLRGLVLDLRWCPGGYLVEATRIAGLFIKDGVVARTRSKNRLAQWEEQEYSAHGVAAFVDLPLVLLVNGETSGGAELIAAALQDHQRAVVAGQRTLGKASIQTQEPLPLPNTGLKLTSGSFLRPSGKALHRFPDSRPGDDWGVRPDPEHETPVSAELGRQLRDWWLQISLRPGEDNGALPLDDPENDPQRQAAVRVLEKMLK